MLDFKLESFEGPFELLLRLIEKNKIDIYKIPAAQITDQYIEYIENNKNMGEMSEFIVMAGTLLELKSRALLPRPAGKPDAAELTEELTAKLLEYKKFKEAAEVFKNAEIFADKTAFKEPETKLIEIIINDRLIKTEELLDGITMRFLYGVFIEAMKRKARRFDTVRASFDSVYKDAFTVEEKIDFLREFLDAKGAVLFSSIIDAARSKNELVTTFLALLELIKLNLVKIIQNAPFEDIFIIYEFSKAKKIG